MNRKITFCIIAACGAVIILASAAGVFSVAREPEFGIMIAMLSLGIGLIIVISTILCLAIVLTIDTAVKAKRESSGTNSSEETTIGTKTLHKRPNSRKTLKWIIGAWVFLFLITGAGYFVFRPQEVIIEGVIQVSSKVTEKFAYLFPDADGPEITTYLKITKPDDLVGHELHVTHDPHKEFTPLGPLGSICRLRIMDNELYEMRIQSYSIQLADFDSIKLIETTPEELPQNRLPPR